MHSPKLYPAGLVLLISLLLAAPVRAQDSVSLQTLRIELWPEFDRSAVLVILSGTLDSNVVLPAEIVLRIPAASGGPHAVATRDDNGNLVNAPYTTADAGDDIAVTVTANYPNFHVEYYDPALVTSGTARNYAFRWRPGLPAASAELRIQEPFGASGVHSDLTLNPAGPGEFGLNYYVASLGPLAADQFITFDIQYDKADPTLSSDAVGASQPITPDLPEPVQGAAVSPWVIGGIAGFGLLLVGGGVYWLVRSNRAEDRGAKPKAKRSRGRGGTQTPQLPPTIYPSSRFCHECGRPLVAGDKFCRNCGTPVRERIA